MKDEKTMMQKVVGDHPLPWRTVQSSRPEVIDAKGRMLNLYPIFGLPCGPTAGFLELFVANMNERYPR